MCLAVPMKLIEIKGEMGTVELGGVERDISLMLLPDAKVGEYLVVHAGFAIQRLDEKDAQETLELLMQMSEGLGDELPADLSATLKSSDDTETKQE